MLDIRLVLQWVENHTLVLGDHIRQALGLPASTLRVYRLLSGKTGFIHVPDLGENVNLTQTEITSFLINKWGTMPIASSCTIHSSAIMDVINFLVLLTIELCVPCIFDGLVQLLFPFGRTQHHSMCTPLGSSQASSSCFTTIESCPQHVVSGGYLLLGSPT